MKVNIKLILKEKMKYQYSAKQINSLLERKFATTREVEIPSLTEKNLMTESEILDDNRRFIHTTVDIN